MKFEEALVHLKQGKKIKAASWKDDYIYSEENRIWYQGHKTYFIGNKDLFEEWELYEEKEVENESFYFNRRILALESRIRENEIKILMLEEYYTAERTKKLNP